MENLNLGTLVLSRRDGEGIVIGRCIHVIVKRSKRGEVSLIIRAPKWIPVDREEIHKQRATDRQSA